jgi:hypothetical protein
MVRFAGGFVGLSWNHQKRMDTTMDTQVAVTLFLTTIPTFVVAAAALVTLVFTGA